MKFLIQSDIVDSNTTHLINKLRERGKDFCEFSLDSDSDEYIGNTWSEVPHDMFVFGSINAVREAKFQGFENVMYGPELNYNRWYAKADPQFVFQKDLVMLTWDCLPKFLKKQVPDATFDYNIGWVDAIQFCRPNSCTKLFPGGLVPEDYQTWLRNTEANYRIDGDELCILARPRAIKFELRTWVFDGKIKCHSYYNIGDCKRNPADYKHDERLEYCQSVLNEIGHFPYRAFVVDWAMPEFPGTDDNRMIKLLEFNSINCSGFHFDERFGPIWWSCDLDNYIDEVEKIWQ